MKLEALAAVVTNRISWDVTQCIRLGPTGFSEEYLVSFFKAEETSVKPVASRSYSSTLKMYVIYSSEISVDFQRTRRRYIPKDISFENFVVLCECEM